MSQGMATTVTAQCLHVWYYSLVHCENYFRGDANGSASPGHVSICKSCMTSVTKARGWHTLVEMTFETPCCRAASFSGRSLAALTSIATMRPCTGYSLRWEVTSCQLIMTSVLHFNASNPLTPSEQGTCSCVAAPNVGKCLSMCHPPHHTGERTFELLVSYEQVLFPLPPSPISLQLSRQAQAPGSIHCRC